MAEARGKKLKPEFQVALACRYAVREQIRKAKAEFFMEHGAVVPCEETGELVSCDTCHIDHAAPLTFQVLVNTFFAAINVNMSRRILASGGDRNSHYSFKNPTLARRFREFHKKTAVLRVVAPAANLKNKVRLPKVERPLVLS